MDKAQILKRIGDEGVVAVVRLDTVEVARQVAEALLAGGVSTIEITYTCPDPPAIIRGLDEAYGDKMLLGAGTVMSAEQARAALDAGATFLVSPCIVPEVIEVAAGRGVPVMPGALTPTEVNRAVQLGADVVKIFPGSCFGPKYFKALRGPMPELKLMPTGGVDLDNVSQWMDAGAVALGVGSNLVMKDAIKRGDFKAIEDKARAFIDAVKAARG